MVSVAHRPLRGRACAVVAGADRPRHDGGDDHRRHRILCRDLAGRGSAGGRALGIAPRGGVRLRADAGMHRAADRIRAFRPVAAAGRQYDLARRLHGVRRGIGDALCGRARLRRRVAGAHQRRAALCRGGSLSPAGAQHERRDFAASAQRRRAVHFARGGDDAGGAGIAAARAWPVRPCSRRRSSGLSHRAFGCGARRRGAQRRIPPEAGSAARRRAGPQRSGRLHLGRNALPAARAGRGSRGLVRSRGRRRDARRHRPQDPGAGARSGAHRRRAGGCVENPLPRHHEP